MQCKWLFCWFVECKKSLPPSLTSPIFFHEASCCHLSMEWTPPPPRLRSTPSVIRRRAAARLIFAVENRISISQSIPLSGNLLIGEWLNECAESLWVSVVLHHTNRLWHIYYSVNNRFRVNHMLTVGLMVPFHFLELHVAEFQIAEFRKEYT